MPDTLKWGIIGTGSIAKNFARKLATSRRGRAIAVASRTPEGAQRFGEEFSLARRHGSYDALIADPEVQAVYIATPHPQHAEWAIRCAEAGKHLLVEKPLAMTAPEAMAVIDAAAANKVFLMEAFMYRCHPQIRRLVEILHSGIIGDVRLIQASFCFHWPNPYDATSRLLNYELGGGGILDVGCYCTSMARLIAGAARGGTFAEPIDVKGCAHIGETGVDEWAVASMRFPNDILAQLSTAVQLSQESVVRIHGSKGKIELPEPWGFREDGSSRIRVSVQGQKDIEHVVPGDLSPYALEADLLAEHLSDGQAPYPAMSWQDTLGNMRALDRWRQAVGYVIPREKTDAFPPTASRRPLVKAPAAPIPSRKIPGLTKPLSRLLMGAQGDRNLAGALFDAFFSAGGNGFDTSWWYGQGQTDGVLGQWMQHRGVRDQCVVLAKGAHTPGCHPAELTRQLLISLERLRTSHADLYIMHRDNEQVPVGEFVDVLNEHQKAGRIGLFGGSNWSPGRIDAANAYARSKGLSGFTLLSNNFSLARMVKPVWDGCISASDPDTRAWLKKTGISLFAWSSQARGFFVRGDPKERSDGELVNAWYSDDNFERLNRARQLGTRKGVSANNIALAYVLAQELPIWCLIGPQNLDELRSTLPALGVSLSVPEQRWLNLEIDRLG